MRYLRLLAALVVVLVGTSLGSSAAFSAQAAPSTANKGFPGCVALVTTYKFVPVVVAEGTTSNLELVVKDCGMVRQTITISQTASMAGCFGVLPFIPTVTVQVTRFKSFMTRLPILAPQCLGMLDMNVTVTGFSGLQVSTANTSLDVVVSVPKRRL